MLPGLVAPEHFFESILESAPDAIVVVDANGTICVVNAQAGRMFAYTRDEMLGEPIELLVPVGRSGHHRDLREKYLEAPQSREMGTGYELVGRRKNGSEFSADVSLSPLHTPDQVFICCAIRDATKRKQMESDLMQARSQAEHGHKTNSAFLAAASHDLRQPVQALSLLGGALRRTVTDPKAQQMLESQAQSLTAMTNLLNSLMDISRLDAGATSVLIEEFSISPLIANMSDEFASQAAQKELLFEARPCNAIVRSDPNMLTEILQNLMSNGIRYTNMGSVELNCQIKGDECHIAVVDSGIGINADQLDQIFEAFHQCEVPGLKTEGFGLGLAIVRRLADLLGHTIRVQSEPGKGSIFSLSVPAVGRDATQKGANCANNVAVDEQPPASGRILVIEDDMQVADALKNLFETAGNKISIASSKEEAIATVEHVGDVPDLIVSDYHLIGRATGVDAIGAIRELLGHNIPAFIITADTAALPHDARTIKNCSIMNKPVDSDRILKLAAQAIQSGKATN